MFRKSPVIPGPDRALPGRKQPMVVTNKHYVNSHLICPPFAPDLQLAMFGLGCFWGAERKFWSIGGVFSTAAGYAGGFTPNPVYEEVCTGMTGHNEVVRVVFDPIQISYSQLLSAFWESHNPTQGMRQGNDVGTQYRSGVYVYDSNQGNQARESAESYQIKLNLAGYGSITTEIIDAPVFYYAEDYHQQYLAKNPGGYCGLGGTGIHCAASDLRPEQLISS